jgi:hypothetical protein
MDWEPFGAPTHSTRSPMSDTHIVYKPTRPEFAISILSGTSTNRGYHETFFEVVSRHAIDQSGWKCLDACGLLGIGQAYTLMSTETITDQVPPALVDRRTGVRVEGTPVDYQGRIITKTVEYDYRRYVIKRICDSGD